MSARPARSHPRTPSNPFGSDVTAFTLRGNFGSSFPPPVVFGPRHPVSDRPRPKVRVLLRRYDGGFDSTTANRARPIRHYGREEDPSRGVPHPALPE